MLYKFLQWLMRLSLSAHYLQIKKDLQKVPKDGPLLIAANHPNAFLDAIIIACLIDRPLHFLARSDVFGYWLSDLLLKQLNLFPIYRKQEGQHRLKHNQATFERSSEILREGGAILVFAEGISIMDMKLRPLKKGLGRIILHHLNQNEKSKLKVATIGINYDRPKEFRSKILIANGENINIDRGWLETFSHPHKAIMDLNREIYRQLSDHIIQVEENETLEFKTLTELDSTYRENSLSRKMLIARTIRMMQKQHPIQASRLKEDAQQALGILKKYHLNFRKLKVNRGLDKAEFLIWICLLPLAIPCLLLNFIPVILSKWLSDLLVKTDEFYASVRLVLNTIFWLIQHLLIMFFLLSMHWSAIFYMPLAFLSMRFYLWFREKTHYLRATYRLLKLRRNSEDYSKLQSLVKEIYRIRLSFGLISN